MGNGMSMYVYMALNIQKQQVLYLIQVKSSQVNLIRYELYKTARTTGEEPFLLCPSLYQKIAIIYRIFKIVSLGLRKSHFSRPNLG